MNKAKNWLISAFLVMTLLISIGVLIYPTFSSWWNSRTQSRAIAKYDEAVSNMDNSEKTAIFEQAEKYNQALSELSAPLSEYDKVRGYESILDITGTGIMGYITIPKINLYLPVYHGTSPEVLNIAVGHLQGTSLPVGGKSRHAVISAHRGLPSSKLFTDIDQLVEDDIFTITILDEIFTYSVDDIKVVLPTEMDALAPVKDEDYVTLMTCTPYGVNTHRLLVRAHRIDTEKPHNVHVPADAVPIDRSRGIPFIVGIVTVMLIIFWNIQGRLRRSAGLTEEFEREKSISIKKT